MPPGHCMDSNSILWDSSALDFLMENLDLSEEEGATSLSNAVPFSGLEGATSQSEFLGSVFVPGWSTFQLLDSIPAPISIPVWAQLPFFSPSFSLFGNCFSGKITQYIQGTHGWNI